MPCRSAARGGQSRRAPIGGPFTLTDDNGATVTEKTLAGKPYAMYFGYTYCPDVCPTTLFDLSRWIQKLGPDADKLDYVFVTVDPERDTAKLMHDYLSSFDQHIRGFTGTPAQIANIAKEYRVYYKKVPTDDGSYTMDHSAIIYLMGAGRSICDRHPVSGRRCVGARQAQESCGADADLLMRRRWHRRQRPGARYLASMTIGAASVRRLPGPSTALIVTVQLPGCESSMPSTCHSPSASCRQAV